jgi:UDP-N-acetylmuramoyl-tripeptide--D-alanyl-D-alanine ligase
MGNYNNNIGLPLTLLRLTPKHQWGVVELGMNHPGEIRRLADICKPDMGVITNIAPAHLEGVGSVEGVLAAKSELLEALSAEGCAILNADDPMLYGLAGRLNLPTILFGIHPRAMIRSTPPEIQDTHVAFVLKLPGSEAAVRLCVPGAFMVSNALAAAAVGYRMGLNAQQIRTGLQTFAPAKGRMNLIKSRQGVHILDDTYNANPGSMKAAMATVAKLHNSGRCMVVLGDMLELGHHAPALHYEVGTACGDISPHRLYVSGPHAQDTASGAMKNGLPPEKIFVGSKPEIIDDLLQRVAPGDWILIKGSRGMAMEDVVRALTDDKEKDK